MQTSWLRSTIAGVALIAAGGAAFAEKANDTLRVAFTAMPRDLSLVFVRIAASCALQQQVRA